MTLILLTFVCLGGLVGVPFLLNHLKLARGDTRDFEKLFPHKLLDDKQIKDILPLMKANYLVQFGVWSLYTAALFYHVLNAGTISSFWFVPFLAIAFAGRIANFFIGKRLPDRVASRKDI
jgi:hypothetical protein